MRCVTAGGGSPRRAASTWRAAEALNTRLSATLTCAASSCGGECSSVAVSAACSHGCLARNSCRPSQASAHRQALPCGGSSASRAQGVSRTSHTPPQKGAACGGGSVHTHSEGPAYLGPPFPRGAPTSISRGRKAPRGDAKSVKHASASTHSAQSKPSSRASATAQSLCQLGCLPPASGCLSVRSLKAYPCRSQYAAFTAAAAEA
mmetsp:Transcript_24315/g.83131  ORF Transcript_24315/g.83131 Transcript_24315/m.83131 type:complete len:205 (+) Transcript_24315:727-1341(+)